MDAAKKWAQKLQAKGKTVDLKELLRMKPDSGTTELQDLRIQEKVGGGAVVVIEIE